MSQEPNKIPELTEMKNFKEFFDRIARDMMTFDQAYSSLKGKKPDLSDFEKASRDLESVLDLNYQIGGVISALLLASQALDGIIDSSGSFTLKPMVDRYQYKIKEFLINYRNIGFILTERTQTIREVLKMKLSRETKN